MGIQGLLRFLKDATTEIHIREYSGRCVAVDTYCWLHRGAFACADKLAKGEKTDQYVKYCMKFVDMLESYNVRPILVFDGCRLPSKKEVEKQRRERRELFMQKGKQFLREGRLNEARDAFTKCISVTPQMALAVMKVARDRGVDCIVAPYEADAQLAYLLKHGYAQAVVTEDSDLLCFGCEKVILKMDLTGRAQEVLVDKFENVKNLQGFTIDTFRHMCILSGCDYLPNIKGIGLAKACKALKLAKNKDIYQAVRKLHQYIKGISPVEAEYAVGFERADKTFLYQLVLDPKSRRLVPLNPYPPDLTPDDVKYAGPLISDEQGLQIAWGNVDINTGKRYADFDADEWLRSKRHNKDSIMCRASIWEKDFFNRVKRSVPTYHENKNGAVEMPSLRGQEAIINVKNLLFSRKKRSELLGGEEALALCTQDSSDKEKTSHNALDGSCGNEYDGEVKLVDIYKDTEKRISPRKMSLRQRMKAKTSAGMDSNTVVKSRFFSSSVEVPSFVEDEETPSITQVDETPETSNSSFTNPQPTVEGDCVLKEILEEMETSIKAEPTKSKDDELSFSAIKSPKKKKELLIKLKEFQRQNDVRSSLPLKEFDDSARKRSITPIKRKNPFAISSLESHTSTSKRKSSSTSSPLKKFRRSVTKPPVIPLECYGNGNSLCEDERKNNDEDCFEVGRKDLIENKESILDVSHVSNEDIPILDDNTHVCRKAGQKHNHDSSEDESKHKIQSLSRKKLRLSPKKRSLMKTTDVGSENKIRNVNHSPKVITSEPIVLDSDEETENIPYIDDIGRKATKRKINLGLNKNTPPQSSSGLLKSKYFGDAKASGLRRKDSSKATTKKKHQDLKNQPKITSLFSKKASSTKLKRKPLSPSKLENDIDYTLESVEDSDVKKIETKMLATRRLFSQTPQR